MATREEVIELQTKERKIEEELLSAQESLQNECDHKVVVDSEDCLLYTSPSPRDRTRSRMPSSA